mmetsp:Transcript_29897/g.84230  ORF Transcript_29897/g.84230 Transcript_29897/m.84230 type:complete len:322 (-) Transcript_29897:360-1325(-)
MLRWRCWMGSILGHHTQQMHVLMLVISAQCDVIPQAAGGRLNLDWLELRPGASQGAVVRPVVALAERREVVAQGRLLTALEVCHLVETMEQALRIAGRRLDVEELLRQCVGRWKPPRRIQLQEPIRQLHKAWRAVAVHVERARLTRGELDLAVVGQLARLWPLLLPGCPEPLKYQAKLLEVAIAGERRLTLGGRQFSNNAPHGPQVDGARVVHGPEEHLRGLVPPRADLAGERLAAPGRPRPAGGRVRVEARGAEVGDPQAPGGGLEQQVRGLQVPVHHAVRVQVRQAAEEHLQDGLDVPLVHRPPLDQQRAQVPRQVLKY